MNGVNRHDSRSVRPGITLRLIQDERESRMMTLAVLRDATRLARRGLSAGCLAVVLAACQSEQSTPTNDTKATKSPIRFIADDYPVTFDHDPALQRVDEADAGYFDDGGWQIADTAPGERLLLLVLPDSNAIATGLWRLGVSRAPAAIDACLTLPPNARDAGSRNIDGRPFHAFTLADAGMSHFQRIEGYRARIDGACYAVDLIVQGTNGQVYDPPRQAPFSADHALERLREITTGLRFEDP